MLFFFCQPPVCRQYLEFRLVCSLLYLTCRSYDQTLLEVHKGVIHTYERTVTEEKGFVCSRWYLVVYIRHTIIAHLRTLGLYLGLFEIELPHRFENLYFAKIRFNYGFEFLIDLEF